MISEHNTFSQNVALLILSYCCTAGKAMGEICVHIILNSATENFGKNLLDTFNFFSFHFYKLCLCLPPL